MINTEKDERKEIVRYTYDYIGSLNIVGVFISSLVD